MTINKTDARMYYNNPHTQVNPQMFENKKKKKIHFVTTLSSFHLFASCVCKAASTYMMAYDILVNIRKFYAIHTHTNALREKSFVSRHTAINF